MNNDAQYTASGTPDPRKLFISEQQRQALDIRAIRFHLGDIRSANDEYASDFPGLTVDIDVALEAITAGMVESDDNEGQIPSDDLDQQLAFGAFMSDGPWWVSRKPESDLTEPRQTANEEL